MEVDRERKPSTVEGYKVIVRSQLLPAFGETPVEALTIRFRVDRDGADTQVLAGADDAHCNLTPVGDQDFFKH